MTFTTVAFHSPFALQGLIKQLAYQCIIERAFRRTRLQPDLLFDLICIAQRSSAA